MIVKIGQKNVGKGEKNDGRWAAAPRGGGGGSGRATGAGASGSVRSNN